ncbi:MAG: flagellar export chaperone FlgN [Ignavibacteriales bacterium]|nr:flagellar export chaperone FlgN [Ignavibacteriales bacterium]MBK7980557.1 flagellar export chaperone FlgN [Ignavibacteriota bacterium]
MNLEKLIVVLEKQNKNLQKLLKSVMEKQIALVNCNNEGLKESISNEEKLLLNIQLAEESRLKIMEELFAEYKIENLRYKLEIFIENIKNKIDENIVEIISLLEKNIKKTIKEIQKVNNQNLVLIQQSRSLINETIKALLNSQKRAIIDRKG